MLIWSSDEVGETFYRFRNGRTAGAPGVMIRLVSDIFLSMRRDLAWPDSKVSALDAMGGRISDLEKGDDLWLGLTVPMDELIKAQKWDPPW